MTPEDFKSKLEELRTVLAGQLADLKKNPKWVTEDERAELLDMLDELGDQLDELSDALQVGADEDDAEDRD